MTQLPYQRGRRSGRATAVGALLIAVGAIAWVLGAVVLRGEHHAYGSGTPPREVVLARGSTYWLGLAGGVDQEIARGVAPSALRCTLTNLAGESVRLSVTPEQRGTKATTQIGSFVAPFSGHAHVSCAGLPNAGVDTATSDPSGYLLVLAAIALAIGVPLTLSGLRTRDAPRPQAAVGAHAA
ncbi:hypothetical protein [uncultured Jatrophihabitans sp.]|uniref:hypothetical protein n=1 Tax=uncultured Jatrophihabitans sp. TaxID=1610747 RepID=UPI0035C9523E